MCRSIADVQFPTAEIRRGKKEEKRRKIETTAAKYNSLPIMACHNKTCTTLHRGMFKMLKQEGQHPLTGQRAPPILVGAGLGDVGL